MWNDIWKTGLERVLVDGHYVEGNNRPDSIELIGHKFTVENPRDRLISDCTKINIFQCIGQFLWITQGNFNVNDIAYYQAKARDYSSDGVIMIGAYGPRLFGIQHLHQIRHLLEILDEDPTTRRAAASIYLPQFDQHGIDNEEIPCTLNLQYLIRNKKVNAVTFMRSQNAYGILPYDLFIFTMLQEYVTAYLKKGHKVELGTYSHFSGSFHVYEKDSKDVHDVLGDKPTDARLMPEMPWKNVELRLREINNFEIALRNAVGTCIEGKNQLNFDLHDGILEDKLEEEYWRQIGRILLCYAAFKLDDKENFKRFMDMLDPTYQYYVEPFYTGLNKADS